MFLSAVGREPPFVFKVTAEGIAGVAGVRVGDQIVSVNGVSVRGEEEALRIMREAVGQINLMLLHHATQTAPGLQRGLMFVENRALPSEGKPEAVNLSTLEC